MAVTLQDVFNVLWKNVRMTDDLYEIKDVDDSGWYGVDFAPYLFQGNLSQVILTLHDFLRAKKTFERTTKVEELIGEDGKPYRSLKHVDTPIRVDFLGDHMSRAIVELSKELKATGDKTPLTAEAVCDRLVWNIQKDPEHALTHTRHKFSKLVRPETPGPFSN